MSWLEVALGALSGGELLALLTLGSSVRKARSEAKDPDIDHLLKVADGWHTLSDERQEENEALRRRIEEQNGKIDELYRVNSEWRDKYNAKCEENASLRVRIATDEVKLCMVRGCEKREPQSGY